MPRITIWIREEDHEAWQKLYSPDWLHSIIEQEAKNA